MENDLCPQEQELVTCIDSLEEMSQFAIFNHPDNSLCKQTLLDAKKMLIQYRQEKFEDEHCKPIEDLELVASRHIANVLKRFEGNRTHAADALGISVRTLQRHLKKWRKGSHIYTYL